MSAARPPEGARSAGAAEGAPVSGARPPEGARSAGQRLAWPGWWLGVALGGFFDGIVLHQVLQWHHLLSGVQAASDLRVQILADGLFHALMYLLALAGLVLLWRRRAALSEPQAGRALASAALIGFGGWHALDAVLSHWILGIHRIRMDVAQPLLWDLAWLAVFGLVPLALGLWLRRARPARRDRGGGGGGRAAATTLGLAVLVAGPLAALPADDGGPFVVVFAPGVPAAQAFNALARLDARVLWADRSGGVWAVQMAEPRQAWRLYGGGALLVGAGAGAAGCLGWTRTAGAGS